VTLGMISGHYLSFCNLKHNGNNYMFVHLQGSFIQYIEQVH